jgi:hypothetical protein
MRASCANPSPLKNGEREENRVPTAPPREKAPDDAGAFKPDVGLKNQ